ncbi:head maturation protease, ClpP-related [Paenibacillus sp. LC231]|uniref:head maturation protease, ClpP-related n=1 Tax=Paenibacillus sp. LC231 TaxID=1120679 RepID=UPI0013922B2E|nr:head maturation protease, ClpP-related [Paenibacillus sp. LC231]
MPKRIKLNGPVIGDSSTWLYDWLKIPYISASKIAKELEDAQGDEVELNINSGGGSVPAGSEVYTLLKQYKGRKVANITGMAASAASFIAMGADEVRMSPTASMMIHNASTWTEGDKNNHYSNADMLRNTDVGITNAYRLKTGKSTEELLNLMNKTTWMNAQQAVELGFADSIMFDESNSLIAVSNSMMSGEIPPEVEAKLRDVLVTAMLKGGADAKNPIDSGNPLAGLDLSAVMSEGLDLNSIINSSSKPTAQQLAEEDQTKEETENMDYEKLKNEHPELFNQIINEGVEQERSRIKELTALAKTPGASDIAIKAMEEGMSPLKAYQEHVSNQAKITENVATARANDAGKSKVSDVTTPDPGNETEDIEDQRKTFASNVAAIVNKKKNGGR